MVFVHNRACINFVVSFSPDHSEAMVLVFITETSLC